MNKEYFRELYLKDKTPPNLLATQGTKMHEEITDKDGNVIVDEMCQCGHKKSEHTSNPLFVTAELRDPLPCSICDCQVYHTSVTQPKT